MLREGEKIKIDGRVGTIFYVNKHPECYQVIFDRDYQELVSFEVVEDAKGNPMQSNSKTNH